MTDEGIRGEKSKGGSEDIRAVTGRIQTLAREIEDLNAQLYRLRKASKADHGLSEDSLRRLDVLSMMLATESRRVSVEPDDSAEQPGVDARRMAFSFPGVPQLTSDADSVGFEIPGVGSVSVGTGGASAEVEGVGSATIGPDGVNVDVGNAGVEVGSDGASVTIPGIGTVGVGSDGSISVKPEDGKKPGGVSVPGFTFPPLPCFEACEFKIPIPVPKFVAEPFEISLGVPQVQTNPVPIPIPVPTPTPTPWSVQVPGFPDVSLAPNPLGPIVIPYPTIGGLIPGVPGAGGTGYNPAVEALVTRLLELAMDDAKDHLRDMAQEVADWGDALGSEVAALATKPRALAEQLASLWTEVREKVRELKDQLAATVGFVTDAARGIAVLLRQLLRGVLSVLKELLKTARNIGREHAERAVGALADIVNPVGAIVSAIRSIFLIVNWIATRVFSIAGFAQELFEEVIEFGAELNAALERLELVAETA